MGKHTSTITINGQNYQQTNRPRNVDGIVRVQKGVPALPTALAPHKAHAVANPTVKKPVMDIARPQPKSGASRKPEPATTLMRTAVKKPQPAVKRRVKVVHPAPALAASATNTTVTRSPKEVSHMTESERLARAAQIKKSHLIKHFTPLTSIKPQPVAAAATPASSFTPVKTADMGAARRQPTTNDLLQAALQKADSHTQPRPAKAKRHARKLKITTAAVVFAVLLGGAVYQNLGTLKLRMAANEAGFAASMPAVRPSGYHMSSLEAASGFVGIDFKSNSDNRSYKITQKPSDLTSSALRDSYVVEKADSYQTVSAAGRTIYLYGDRNATWVNGGIWYLVESNGSLSNQQLIEIAASM